MLGGTGGGGGGAGVSEPMRLRLREDVPVAELTLWAHGELCGSQIGRILKIAEARWGGDSDASHACPEEPQPHPSTTPYYGQQYYPRS